MTKTLTGSVILFAILALAVATVAQQNQNANPPQNQQTQQTQQTQQNQPAQPAQKKSWWQKVKDASQAGQNAIQQGSNTVQQGQGTIQQTGQQVQGTVQQIPNQVQQGPNGTQSVPNGMQQASDNGQGVANSFQASGGGAGACGPSCFDAGVFQANVSQMTLSQEGGWHVIRMNIQFHNATDQPLVIAYHDGSMVMVDNNGNTYIPAGGNPGQLQGMGIDRGTQTDSQFQLGPGQTGYALFSVARGRAANSPVGTSYSYNLTIDELQLQNGALAIPVRMYNLNFPSLVAGTSSASFAPASAPATGVAANANRTGNAGSAAGTLQSVPGQHPVGTAGATVPNVAGQRQAGAIGASTPSVAGQHAVGATPAVATTVGVPAQQQRMVSGKVTTATPAQATPAPAVNNAAIKTPIPAAIKAPVSAPARAQAAPVVATKPSPASVKPATTAPPKKAPAATTTSK